MSNIDNELIQFFNKQQLCKDLDKSKSNVISLDQRRGSYYICPENIGEMMKLLNKARKMGRKSHFLEKQNPELSGIFLDFDFIYDKPNTWKRFTDIEIQKLVILIFQEISNHTDDEIETYSFVLKKNKPLQVDKVIKDGLHILIPKLMTTKQHKKYLIERLRANEDIQKLFREHKISNYEKCIDPATAQNPSCFYGSCKDAETAEPYVLKCIYKIEYIKLYKMFQPYFIKISDFEENHNLVFDLSLTFPSDDDTNENEGIDTFVFNLNKRTLSEVAKIKSFNEIDELEELIVSNYDAKVLKSLIDILLPKYYNNYEEWRNILFVIHSLGEEFKILAIYFSQKSSKFDMLSFENTWNSITNVKNGLTKSTLYFYAKESNLEEYKKIIQTEGIDTMISDCIFRTNGKIKEDDISKILEKLYGDRYVFENTEQQWYELILNKKNASNNEYYGKFKPANTPGNGKDKAEAPMSLQKKIKDKRKFHDLFEKQFNMILDKIKEARVDTSANNESQTKETDKIKNLNTKLNNLRKSIEDFCSTAMLNKVFGSKQTCIDFYREGFIDLLDCDDHILGVNSGILDINHMDLNIPGNIKVSKFRTYDPTHNVSKTTKSNFKKFNPYAPTVEQMKILNCIRDIIVERDARLWILLFMSTAMRADMKQPLMLFWEGSGSNGKTFLVQLWSTCFGDYGTKIRSSVLTSLENTASGANSALCMIRGMRACFIDEFNRKDALNTKSLKELASSNGKIATRDLYKRESIVDVKCTIIVASNYSPTIADRDDGTWRRIAKYVSKKKFINGEPKTRFEQRADPQFAPELTNRQEYRDTMLSIMEYFNLMFLTMFEYDISKVKAKTIQCETKNERFFQDSYFRFSNKYFILPKNNSYVNANINTQQMYDMSDNTINFEYEQFTINKIIEDYKEFYEHEYGVVGKKLMPPNESLKKDLIETDTIVKFLTEGNTKTIPCRINKHWTTAAAILAPNEYYAFEYDPRSNFYEIPTDRLDWWIFDEETLELLGRSLDEFPRAPIIEEEEYDLPGIIDFKNEFYDKIIR